MAHKTQISQTEWETQHENLLIAIDQLEQMTEVMTEVLSRVKQQVNVLEDSYQSKANNKAKKTKNTKTSKNKKVNLVH